MRYGTQALYEECLKAWQYMGLRRQILSPAGQQSPHRIRAPHAFTEAMTEGRAHVLQAAARILLHDWNDGRIPFFTMPPQRDTHGHAAAAVIPSWSQDFNVDEVGTSAKPLLEEHTISA